MNTSLRIVLAIAFLLTGISQSVWAQNKYYWAVGSGDWSTKENWKVLSPGASAGTLISSINDPLLVTASSQPTANDNVFFNLAPFPSSGSNAARTVTVSMGAQAGNIDWTGAANGPTFQINGPLTVAGSLTFITNMVVNATNSGSITLTATGQATITSVGKTLSMPITFNGNGGRWTLNGDLNVTNLVTFTRGYLIASPGYIPSAAIPKNTSVQLPANVSKLVFSAAASAKSAGASDSSYVMGYVQKTSASSSNIANDFVLPVGNTFDSGEETKANYRPIIVGGFSNSAKTITARYINASPNSNPPLDTNKYNSGNFNLNSVTRYEYWFLGGSGSMGKVSVSYNRPGADKYYFFNDPWRRKNLTVVGWKYNDGLWSDISNAMPNSINTTDRIVSANGGVNQTEFISIGSRGVSPLPVRLVSFSALQLDGQVQLKWQSAEEKNTAYFEVERSADGKNFALVLTKKAQGNSSSLVSYNAIDSNPISGTSYYRLKMVNLDGTFEYSSMVSVSSEGAVQVRAYPNPSNGREVQFLALNGDKLVLQSVMDSFGKPLGYEANSLYGQGVYVNFYGPLPAGFYVATLVTDDEKRERVRVKFVVQ